MQELVQRIERKEATIGVIGLGYVGLSVAAAFASAGFRVTGVDIDAERVAKLNDGQCPIGGNEPELPELIRRVTAGQQLIATTDHSTLANADVVLIDVDTPVCDDKRARFVSLRAACRDLGRVLRRGTLVIVESTISPGTCDSLVVPILEHTSGKKAHQDFWVGHCPERVMPGRLLRNLREMPRVCGGSTPDTAQAMVALYRFIVGGKLEVADCLTAELTKTAENAYRDVNIAFANELALVCESVGAEFQTVRRLVNDSPERHVHLAGAGVGGHCIPTDPWLLAHGAPDVNTRLIATARAVNDAMPQHVAGLVAQALGVHDVPIHDASVAVLGCAYLENSDDTRNSPTDALLAALNASGAHAHVHDPFVREADRDMWKVVEGKDAVVIMVAHDAYRNFDLERLKRTLRRPIIVDGRHVIDAAAARGLGFTLRAVGLGIRPPATMPA